MDNVGQFAHNSPEDNLCVLCSDHLDLLNHLFFVCLVAQILWREAPWPIIITNIPYHTTAKWLRFILKSGLLLPLPSDQ